MKLLCKICGKERQKGQLKCNSCSQKQFQKRQREKIRKEKKQEKKANSIPHLKELADQVFSQWIRERDRWTCQTCWRKLDKNNAQCSHFISRTNMATRYEPKNCICQCAKENMFQEGNKPAFSLYLVDKYGVEIIRELVRQGNQVVKVSPEFFKEIIAEYSFKLQYPKEPLTKP